MMDLLKKLDALLEQEKISYDAYVIAYAILELTAIMRLKKNG